MLITFYYNDKLQIFLTCFDRCFSKKVVYINNKNIEFIN